MTSNLLNIKSKQIERQTREQPSCKNRTRRKSYCPVRERIVTEYLFHVDDIERDTKEGQARIQDCAQGHISELADQLEQEGQGHQSSSGMCGIARTGLVHWRVGTRTLVDVLVRG